MQSLCLHNARRCCRSRSDVLYVSSSRRRFDQLGRRLVRNGGLCRRRTLLVFLLGVQLRSALNRSWERLVDSRNLRSRCYRLHFSNLGHLGGHWGCGHRVESQQTLHDAARLLLRPRLGLRTCWIFNHRKLRLRHKVAQHGGYLCDLRNLLGSGFGVRLDLRNHSRLVQESQGSINICLNIMLEPIEGLLKDLHGVG